MQHFEREQSLHKGFALEDFCPFVCLVLLQVELGVIMTASHKSFDSLIYFGGNLLGEASSVDLDGVPA